MGSQIFMQDTYFSHPARFSLKTPFSMRCSTTLAHYRDSQQYFTLKSLIWLIADREGVNALVRVLMVLPLLLPDVWIKADPSKVIILCRGKFFLLNHFQLSPLPPCVWCNTLFYLFIWRIHFHFNQVLTNKICFIWLDQFHRHTNIQIELTL